MVYWVKRIINDSESRPRKSRLVTDHKSTDQGSSDGFQDEKAKISIISLIRSNKAGKVGVLSSKNRINVLLRSELMASMSIKCG